MHLLKLLNSSLMTTSRIFCIRRFIKKSDFVTVLSTAEAMPRKSKKAQKSYCDLKSNVSVNFVYLEVMGSGAHGSPASVVVVTNYGRYLINCGEGTMRLSNEYKAKLQKSPHVFITYPSWKNISGLFGLALAAQESRISELFIHSDSEVGSLFSIVTKFVNLRHLQVKIKKCSHYEEYSDGIISVKYVLLRPSWARGMISSESSGSESDLDESGVATSESGRLTLCKKSKSPSRCIREKSPSMGSQTHNRKSMNYATSFIFKTEGSQGSLNYSKCVEYGVPQGPLLGKLKNGIDVTLEDGSIVRSADVIGPGTSGVTFIVMECPSEDYLDSLLEEPAFCPLQSVETPAEAVIHFSSPSVIKNSKYQEWMARFPKSTLHLFLNEDNKRSGSVGIHRQQYRLNLLHPELFPLLDDSGIPDYPRNNIIPDGHTPITECIPGSCANPIYKDRVFFKCESNSFIRGETLCQLYLKPKSNFDYSRSIVLKRDEFYNEVFENAEIRDKIEKSKQELELIDQKLTSGNIYPKIVFLGTGSSKPSKVRNGSGILLYVSKGKSILLDCGEFTYGQLISFYGKAKAREVLRSLQAIYISHMHLDHHMGLITILKERKLAFDEWTGENEPDMEERKNKKKDFTPIFILAPVQMLKLLDLYSQKFEDIKGLYELIPNAFLLPNSKKYSKNFPSLKNNLGMSGIKTVTVVHCPNSFGVAMMHKTGWKITYSGDTRPSQALIEIGQNSDILIHEATLEDAYENEARIKLHSTTSQAIDVGRKMNAKYILLTHFSQRYCYLPYIDFTSLKLNVGIAFDFMEVPFYKLPLVPALIKPLQFILSKYDEINKTTTETLLLKREAMRRSPIEFNNMAELMGTPAKISKRD